jgi:cell fate (sporulation/competence/biofilm development) regulator YlbF (YheA/YmcA/DUF963 family)
MDSETTMETSLIEAQVSQRAQTLGALLRETVEFRAFLQASQGIEENALVQKLLEQIESHRSALQWGLGDTAEHRAALRKLQAQLEALPSVQAYRQAERVVRDLFRAVDALISEAAGVDFAVNARRSCCGG